MTGLKIKRVLAKMDVVVPGRKLDDNDQILVEYEGGATGIYWTSQFAIGCDNSLRVRIYGSKGTILWFQENPEEVIWIGEDGIAKSIKRGYGTVTPDAAKYGRASVGTYGRVAGGHGKSLRQFHTVRGGEERWHLYGRYDRLSDCRRGRRGNQICGGVS